eukprot:scaffold7060_cov280-Pinguiococcus_pyrenoidosus.AAC.5
MIVIDIGRPSSIRRGRNGVAPGAEDSGRKSKIESRRALSSALCRASARSRAPLHSSRRIPFASARANGQPNLKLTEPWRRVSQVEPAYVFVPALPWAPSKPLVRCQSLRAFPYAADLHTFLVPPSRLASIRPVFPCATATAAQPRRLRGPAGHSSRNAAQDGP